MDLKYPDSHCNLSLSGSHYFVEVDGLGIWQCKYCLAAKWLPSYDEVVSFGFAVRRSGIGNAYNRFLSRRPAVVKKLKKFDGKVVKRKPGAKVICFVAIGQEASKERYRGDS